jgi:hypothetical protein
MLPSRLLATTVYRPCRSAASDRIISTTLPALGACARRRMKQGLAGWGRCASRPATLAHASVLQSPATAAQTHTRTHARARARTKGCVQQAPDHVPEAHSEVLGDVAQQQRERDERKEVLREVR